MGLLNLGNDANIAAINAANENATITDRINIADAGPLMENKNGFWESATQGSLEATGLQQAWDLGRKQFGDESDSTFINMQQDAKDRTANMAGYAVGAMGSMASPFMSGMNYGRGLAAMSLGARTAVGASKIGSSVAKRQAQKGAGAFFRDAADNGLGQAIKKNKFDSGMGNFIAEEASGIGLGVGYDYVMDETNQATYDRESRFDLGNSLAMNAAMSVPFAGGMAATRLIKGANINKAQVKDYKEQAAETGGMMKLRPSVANAMRKKGG